MAQIPRVQMRSRSILSGRPGGALRLAETPAAPQLLQALIVDDQPQARSRLCDLLGQCDAQPAGVAVVVGEASNAAELQALLAQQRFDVVLLDIDMPGEDGIAIARFLSRLPNGPAVVFIAALPDHAITAFELDAVDYLTKPVPIERLQQALQKADRWLQVRRWLAPQTAIDMLLIQDRGGAERVPLSEVLYLKSEFKYLTVHTAERSHLFDGTLSELEARYPTTFVRVHRNALVARAAIRMLQKYRQGDNTEGWAVWLTSIDAPIMVSRRQLSAVREVLRN